MSLPPLVTPTDVQRRLQSIFPEGATHRSDCVNKTAARTVFVMLYAGAVEGREVWLRPDQVTRMTDDQAASTGDAERLTWLAASVMATGDIPGRWYAVNTRESIRDNTLRNGLVPNNAVAVREVPTTSQLGRYALRSPFAALFDPALSGATFVKAAADWRAAHMSTAALGKVALLQMGAAKSSGKVSVTLPNGETRMMAPGPSSVLTKAVIEEFAPRFLNKPGVLWLSESAKKVVAQDDSLAKLIGLKIDPARNLPDVILVDVGGKGARLVFVEVVNSDGHVTELRKEALTAYAVEAGFAVTDVSFVTAYFDRGHQAFRKTVQSLAWAAYAWFMSEPDRLLEFHELARPPQEGTSS